MIVPEWILVGLFSALLSGLICGFAFPLGRVLGLLDDPTSKSHSRHSNVTPLLGGLAALSPVILFAIFGSHLEMFEGLAGRSYLYPWMGHTVAAMMVLGMLDDRFCVSAKVRLVLATLAFLSLVALHPLMRIGHVHLPAVGVTFVLGWAAIPFTLLCLVALANAVNMADGRNGLVTGMCLIWTIALLPVLAPYLPLGLLMLLVSLLVVFVCNLRGRLFLGDGGTYGLAAYFGLVVISIYEVQPDVVTTAQVATLFMVPLLDMGRLILSRLRRGVSPFCADHEHLHHYLDDWLGWRWGLPLYLGLVALPISLAFFRSSWAFEAVGLGFALYLMIFNAARLGRVSRKPAFVRADPGAGLDV